MSKYHQKSFSGESVAYRKQRDELLQAEMELRRQIEAVAQLRRELPIGGALKTDYIFEEKTAEGEIKKVKLSELFQDDKNTLIIYSFMFAPNQEKPCTSCNSILDGLNGQARHFTDRVNFAAVGKAPIQKFRNWAKQRGWNGLRLLSSYNNSYNTDYHAEDSKGRQWPALNVFQKNNDGIYHFYSTELLYVPSEEGQEGRHVDMIWPLWNLYDMTPEGRGTDWHPRHSYDRNKLSD